MKPFTSFTAVAAPIDSPNVDTDQIAPARFLRKPREDGYGQFLFHDLRFDANGAPKPDFVLNREPFAGAGVLVANRNFGGGSSREQAVWCLVDYGIRCVIGSSFGDIFFNNAVNHGLLLIREDDEQCHRLRELLWESPGMQCSVDLEAQTYAFGHHAPRAFDIESSRRKRLLLGLDEIGLTLQYEATIDRFEQGFRQRHPWLFDRPTG